MRILLDTHALLWALFAPQNLSERAREVVNDPRHEKLVSVASVWEIAIKQGLGKLPYPGNLHQLIDDSDSEYLTITPEHCHAYSQLPHDGAHRDPFDRMLVVQAIEEDAHLLSRDPALDRYGVRRVW
ncbi:MAG: type II toxin-antitoxin system VapC family toxin [Alphaproteobacteria bacterium]|jgi:PIN domain nuclease of toxin-antitoxin system|nr:type II toxin-antitoxin system VapC family toxin [Alphaproteobacteria bacterium]